MSADGNNAGNLFELDAILAVVLGGTSLNGGRFFLFGSMVGALIIQTLTTTIYAFNVPPGNSPGRQGPGRVRGEPPAVGISDRCSTGVFGNRRDGS